MIISVENQGGLSVLDTLNLRQNRDPYILQYPHPTLPLQIGSEYVDTIVAVDNDGDPVRYKKSDGPASLSVDSVSGRIVWSPSTDDHGTDEVGITVQDPFGALLHSFSVLVLDSSEVPEPIRFITREEDFPAVLQASRDTMRVPLQVAPGTGKKPFQFTVTTGRETESAAVIDSGEVVWTPQAADTGNYMLTVRVIDLFSNRVQIFPHIRVVPPNREFTLSSRWTGDTTASGALNLYGTAAPESLLVTVHDPDTGIADSLPTLRASRPGAGLHDRCGAHVSRKGRGRSGYREADHYSGCTAGGEHRSRYPGSSGR